MAKMAVLQTKCVGGRHLKRILLANAVCRLWTTDKQEQTKVGIVSEADRTETCTNAEPGDRHRPLYRNMARYFSWMSHHAPAFKVRGDNIDVLPSPSTFYDTLKEEAGRAKKRIVISSLYLGTGQLEKQLVNELYASQTANPELRVSILLDYTRGSRGQTNSRTMLLPLIKDFGSRARISLYHTPDLRGFLKWIVPERFNETIGVQHMKIYLFDDNLIISGANLSESYFTDRQDRYMLLRDCGALADYCEQLVNSVASSSFQLQSDNSVKMDDSMQNHPYKGKDNGEAYKDEFKSRVSNVINPDSWKASHFHGNQTVDTTENINICTNQDDSGLAMINDSSPRRDSNSSEGSDQDLGNQDSTYDTWVMPLIQMATFGITVDDDVTKLLWRGAPEDAVMHLASGYLNLPLHYENIILKESAAVFNILTAHPEANGFLGAGGLAGSIPSVYTLIARQFYNQTREHVQRHRIHLNEFKRAGWTFHGKGLWYYMPGENLPNLTYIGSPNFGYRSVYRDLEAQFAIVTENPRLRNQLHNEQEHLFRRGTEVSKQTFERTDRYVSYWVQWATYFIRSFF